MRKTALALLLIAAILIGIFAAIMVLLRETNVQALSGAGENGDKPIRVRPAATSAVTDEVAARLGVAGTPITIRPTALDGYLPNPGMGWQHKHGNGEQLLPETVMYAPRHEISWFELNPAAGEYDWTELDQWIDRAAQMSKQISFRVYTMRGETYGGHQLPHWVLDQGATLTEAGDPDYSNCTYQATWARFVNALRERYDGDPQIAFIDISGYGNFNEWGWMDGQTDWDSNVMKPESLDGQARRRLADLFIGGRNRSHQCRTAEGEIKRVRYNYPGFQSTQLVMPYAGVRQSTQYVANRRDDVGIRFDCLGDGALSEGMLERIGVQLDNVWYTAPIVFEFCAFTTTEPDTMQAAEKVLRTTHASLVHDNLERPRNAEVVAALMPLVGYRYMLLSATYPAAVAPDEAVPVLMKWQNTGRAPAYPRMGQDFALHIALVDRDGVVAHDQTVEARIADWMPSIKLDDEPPVNTVGALLEPPTPLPAGSYTLRVSIVDQRSGQPLNLTFEGGDANGWYTIGTLDVTTGTS